MFLMGSKILSSGHRYANNVRMQLFELHIATRNAISALQNADAMLAAPCNRAQMTYGSQAERWS